MEFWIARDKVGFLSIFKNEPFLTSGGWMVVGGDQMLFVGDSDSFPEVTFENSPQKIRLELVKEEEL